MAAPMDGKGVAVKVCDSFQNGVDKENVSDFCISQKDFQKIFPRCQVSRMTVTLSRNKRGTQSIYHGGCILSVCPNVDFDSSNVDSSSNPETTRFITVYCTPKMMEEYNFVTGDIIYMKPMNSFPLNRLTIGTTNPDAFSWANTQIFSTGLLVSVCAEKILVKKNGQLTIPHSDIFMRNENFKQSYLNEWEVLDCDPLLVGFLTVKTALTVVKLENQIEKSYTQSVKENSNMDFKPFMLSDFMSSLAKSMSDNSSILYPQNIENSIRPCSRPISKQFSVDGKYCQDTVLNCDYFKSLSILRRCESDIFDGDTDLHSSVFLNKTTAIELGLFEGCLVEISAPPDQMEPISNGNVQGVVSKDNHPNGAKPTEKLPQDARRKTLNSRMKRKRIHPHLAKVRIESKSSVCKKDTVFMLQSLYFNALWDRHNVGPKQVYLKKFGQKVTNSGAISQSTSWSLQIPKASEIHISIVYGPNYSVGQDFGALLVKYFQVPRILIKGDIFYLDSSDDPDFYQDSADSSGVRTPLIFFRVTKILPKVPGFYSYTVHKDHTVMFQMTIHVIKLSSKRVKRYEEGAVHTYIPSEMQNFCSKTLALPLGLEHYADKIMEWVRPFLVQREGRLTKSTFLLTAPNGSGKTAIAKYVADKTNMNFLKVNCSDLCGDSSSATESRLQAVMERASTFCPCVLLLQNIHCLGIDPRDGRTEDPRVARSFHENIKKLGKEDLTFPVITIATAPDSKLLAPDMHEGFLHHIHVDTPNETSRVQMLTSLLEDVPCAVDVSVQYLAQRTAGFVLGDLDALLCEARKLACRRIWSHCIQGRSCMSFEEEVDICNSGFKLEQSDFVMALDKMQASHSDAIGAPKIPNVTWEDVGGLADIKSDILDTIQLPLQHPELFAAGLRRSGVLFYGPPGTGKTLLAKAVATECSLNFLSVKGPELINMYVGQSEENVREVFQRARSATPCVIFFDELDSLAPNRGRSGDSGGVMDRVVSQLLAELDGLHKACDVFIIGATNRPDLLDPALLRPGRFDKLLYLGVSDTRDAQLNIMKALTRKFKLSRDCCLQSIVEKCPYNMTGADFYALCSDAMLNAMKYKIELLEAGQAVDEQDIEVQSGDFEEALRTLVPSVSAAELDHFKNMQQMFSTKT